MTDQRKPEPRIGAPLPIEVPRRRDADLGDGLDSGERSLSFYNEHIANASTAEEARLWVVRKADRLAELEEERELAELRASVADLAVKLAEFQEQLAKRNADEAEARKQETLNALFAEADRNLFLKRAPGSNDDE